MERGFIGLAFELNGPARGVNDRCNAGPRNRLVAIAAHDSITYKQSPYAPREKAVNATIANGAVIGASR